MEISNIASHQVNFKSQTKTQTSPIEAVKNKFENLEDGEKITAGLSALGVLSLAALFIAKRHIVGQKPVKQAAQIASGVVEEAVKKYPKVEVGHAPKDQKQQENISQGVKRAIEATKEYIGGGNYGTIRSNATRNLSHDGKKVVNVVLDQAHSAVAADKIAQECKLSSAVDEASKNAKNIKNARQGIQKATREQLVKSLDQAYDSAYQAQMKAQQAQIEAQELGTKKAHKAAFRAEKAAQRAEIEADTTRYRAHQRSVEFAQQQAKKEANVAEQLASPNYKDGQIKQMLNADKQAKTRLSNLIKKKTQHGKMSEKQALELIIKDSKETEITRKLAQERLAIL